jgi:repressor LexA
MKELTARQKETLEFISGFIKEHGYPPTMREIAASFGVSVKAAHDHVKALQKKGRIKCDLRRSRAIEIVPERSQTEPADETVDIPVLGNVAAGKPLFAEENFENTIKFPASSLRRGAHFALQVKGDSMQDAGILDGDTAIFLKKEHAENGDIVVARVNEEAVTLKRFYKESNRIKLKAENSIYPPIYSQNVQIIGTLEHILRSYR